MTTHTISKIITSIIVLSIIQLVVTNCYVSLCLPKDSNMYVNYWNFLFQGSNAPCYSLMVIISRSTIKFVSLFRSLSTKIVEKFI